MSALIDAIAVYAALPWAELIPCPHTPAAAALTLALGFWYGYRHPKGF